MQTIIVYLLAQVGDAPPEAEPAEMKPWLILAGAFLVISMVMFRNLRQKVAKSQAHDRMSVAERVAKTKPARDMHDQISELMAELADLSRQLNGQLDTRMARLEILLAQADQAIADLSGRQPAHNQRPQTKLPRQVDTPAPPPESKSASAHQPANLTAQERAILDMTQQGMDVTQISQKLGRPAGEIQLILSLKRPPSSL